jgi:hypothetical protein
LQFIPIGIVKKGDRSKVMQNRSKLKRLVGIFSYWNRENYDRSKVKQDRSKVKQHRSNEIFLLPLFFFYH